MKFCTRCQTHKALNAFGKDNRKKDGLTSTCKECRNPLAKAWRDANPTRVKEINDASRERRKSYYSDPERKLKYRSLDLRRRFGLTHADYEKILKAQNGVCKICRRFQIEDTKGYMTLDHCHKTGKVRGVLCSRCNRGLGIFEDSTELLFRAIDYLTLGDLI